MRIVLFADNYIGLKVIEILKSHHENIVGMFVHPPEHQNFYKEIVDASGLPEELIYPISKEWNEESIKKLKALMPDIILVVFWRYILPKKVFKIPSLGCINFHMSYLPYNKGKKPNVWPIIDGTPCGISMHYIDEGIDTGKIIAREKVDLELIDTGKTIYEKMIKAFPPLFEKTWPTLKDKKTKTIFTKEKGTFHFDKEFEKLNEINLEEKVYPLDLINLLRAKTFPPHNPAYFIKDGKKVFVTIKNKFDESYYE